MLCPCVEVILVVRLAVEKVGFATLSLCTGYNVVSGEHHVMKLI